MFLLCLTSVVGSSLFGMLGKDRASDGTIDRVCRDICRENRESAKPDRDLEKSCREKEQRDSAQAKEALEKAAKKNK